MIVGSTVQWHYAKSNRKKTGQRCPSLHLRSGYNFALKILRRRVAVYAVAYMLLLYRSSSQVSGLKYCETFNMYHQKKGSTSHSGPVPRFRRKKNFSMGSTTEVVDYTLITHLATSHDPLQVNRRAA